ncbi:hypothetical protein HK405_012386 [Cladochytrium tenue]|nr:hypothetical protein HK405_012386 [Cladochytrium tenue]
MAFSLCQRFLTFARHLLAVRDAANSDPDSVFRCSPSLLFSRLVTDLLCEIFAADGGASASSETVVLLVDALDKCGLGFEAIPYQVKIIFTSPPDGDIVAAMAVTGALEHHIPSDANRQADAQAVASRGVRAILKRRAGLPPFALSTAPDATVHDFEVDGAAVADITNTLLEKSGSFLVWLAVAHCLLEESDPGGTARDICGSSTVAAVALAVAAAKLPVGLASLHASVFRPPLATAPACTCRSSLASSRSPTSRSPPPRSQTSPTSSSDRQVLPRAAARSARHRRDVIGS